MKKSLSNHIYKTACNLCEWLQKQLYDEKTWQELEDENNTLQSKIEDLENKVEYYQDLEEYRTSRRYA